MKRMTRSVLAALLFCAGAISFAQTPPPPIPEFPVLQSIQSGSTFGMFTNVLDAAITIDESATDIAFSKIGKSYFFGGIAANPNWNSISSSGAVPIFGYYHAGNRPWSLFGQLNYTGTGDQTVDIKEGNITRKPFYRDLRI